MFSPLRAHPPPETCQFSTPVEFDDHTVPRAIVDEAGSVRVCHLKVGVDSADTICSLPAVTLKANPVATHKAVKRFTRTFDFLFIPTN